MLDKLRDCLDSKFDKYMPKLDNGEWKYSGSFGYYAINVCANLNIGQMVH